MRGGGEAALGDKLGIRLAFSTASDKTWLANWKPGGQGCIVEVTYPNMLGPKVFG